MSQDWQANRSSSDGWDAGPGPGRPPPPPPPPGYGYQAPPPGYGSPPGAYGGYQPGYGAPAPRTDGTAIAALILAIASFVVCPLIPAVIALAIIPGSRRTVEMSGGTVDGLGILTAAKVIAWIKIGLSLLGIIGFAIAIAVSSGSSTNNAIALRLALMRGI